MATGMLACSVLISPPNTVDQDSTLIIVTKKGGETIMELLKRLVVEEEGQGLVEYSLIVLLVALVFWVAIQGTNADQALSNAWNDITACLNGGTAAAGC
jgi:Flp pilus assembly pilin Flp